MLQKCRVQQHQGAALSATLFTLSTQRSTHQSPVVPSRLEAAALAMSGRYYALLAGGPLGIAGLAELYRHDSVSKTPPDSDV